LYWRISDYLGYTTGPEATGIVLINVDSIVTYGKGSSEIEGNRGCICLKMRFRSSPKLHRMLRALRESLKL